MLCHAEGRAVLYCVCYGFRRLWLLSPFSLLSFPTANAGPVRDVYLSPRAPGDLKHLMDFALGYAFNRFMSISSVPCSVVLRKVVQFDLQTDFDLSKPAHPCSLPLAMYPEQHELSMQRIQVAPLYTHPTSPHGCTTPQTVPALPCSYWDGAVLPMGLGLSLVINGIFVARHINKVGV